MTRPRTATKLKFLPPPLWGSGSHDKGQDPVKRNFPGVTAMAQSAFVPQVISRRQAIAWAGAGCGAWALRGGRWSPELWAAEPAAALLPPLNRFPHMVQEYFVGRVRGVEREADRVRQALKTRADAEQYALLPRAIRGDNDRFLFAVRADKGERVRAGHGSD